MKITALAGGVGGAKLLVGLQTAVDPAALTAIVNTGDDALVYGVHVSPDIDIVTYWLAGVADVQRGWGISGDTFTVVETLRTLGADAWFGLGDRDFATCLHRTERLRSGATLTAVTDEIRRRLGVATEILPMSDDPVPTLVHCADGRVLEFQEYFVRERHEPAVERVESRGLEEAKPAPGVLEAIEQADRIVICPSNPMVSIGPILGLRGVRDALRTHPSVIAVSPIVQGRALKGPADRMLEAAGLPVRAASVARLYEDFCDVFVVDESDADEIGPSEEHGVRTVAVPTIMHDHAAATELARALVAL